MSQPTQSQIDRANAWAAETYPADTAEQRQVMAALELDVIVAADAAKAEREAFAASPEGAAYAAALDRFRRGILRRRGLVAVMTFPDLLTAIGYKPRPYAHRAFARCWAIEGRGLTLGIVAAAVLDYETDARLDPDARAMMIRALRGASFDALGLDVVLYFPTERIQESS